MINHLFDKALNFDSTIWSSWIGLICVLVILVSCLFNIYSNWVDDTFADRIYYWAMILTSVAVLITAFECRSNPKLVFESYMILIAIRSVCEIIERIVFRFYGGK